MKQAIGHFSEPRSILVQQREEANSATLRRPETPPRTQQAFAERKPSLLLAITGSVLSLFLGCLPIPHTTERSPEVYGRVLDARTHAPIHGAQVSLSQPPHHSTYTDAAGRFRLRPTRNFHFAYVAPEGGSPGRKDDSVTVSHPKYRPYGFLANAGGDIGDILLEPSR